jgi:hypothetical protein
VYLCVLIVFSLLWESLKLILVDESLPEVVLSHLCLGVHDFVKKISNLQASDTQFT